MQSEKSIGRNTRSDTGNAFLGGSIWEQIFSTQEWGKYPAEDLIRFISRKFQTYSDKSTIRILELGCGPGANLWYLAREGYVTYGIDISASAITQARKRLDEECLAWRGELVVGDIVELPFENAFFDAVIDIEAIYCNSYEKSRKIYQEAARVCKKNGFIYSRTFASGSWGDCTGQPVGHHAWLTTEGPFAGKGFSRFTEKQELQDLLSPFKIVELETISRTFNQQKHEIKEWTIIGEKL